METPSPSISALIFLILGFKLLIVTIFINIHFLFIVKHPILKYFVVSSKHHSLRIPFHNIFNPIFCFSHSAISKYFYYYKATENRSQAFFLIFWFQNYRKNSSLRKSRTYASCGTLNAGNSHLNIIS